MAIVICVECGQKISTLATFCPHCGCPKEYQVFNCEVKENACSEHDIVKSNTSNEVIKNEVVLKNIESWRKIKSLSKTDRQSAVQEVIDLTKTQQKTASEFIDKLKMSIGIPADLIIEFFPEQSDTVIEKHQPAPTAHHKRNDDRHNPTQLRDRDAWETIRKLSQSGRSLVAINEIKKITGNPNLASARFVVDTLRCSDSLPVSYILDVYPEQVATGTDSFSGNEELANLRYAESWKQILSYVRNRDAIRAINKIKSILSISYDVLAEEIYDEILLNDKVPLGLLQTKYPNQLIESKKQLLTSCSACGKTISSKAETCPNCGQPTGVHVCPRCGSTNTHVLTGFDKTVSTALWGRFAANEVMSKYWCEDCRHKW